MRFYNEWKFPTNEVLLGITMRFYNELQLDFGMNKKCKKNLKSALISLIWRQVTFYPKKNKNFKCDDIKLVFFDFQMNAQRWWHVKHLHWNIFA